MVEWSILSLVVVLLLLVFAYKVRVVHGQGELAALHSTLGNLRTAFVIDHLQRSLPSGSRSLNASQRNPFELLQRRQPNYFGEIRAVQAATVPPGSWVFDADCVCIGYLPLNSEWFESPSGDVIAWYRIEGAPGPWQLTAKEAYRWQGQVLN
jgi:hypothetical protein